MRSIFLRAAPILKRQVTQRAIAIEPVISWLELHGLTVLSNGSLVQIEGLVYRAEVHDVPPIFGNVPRLAVQIVAASSAKVRALMWRQSQLLLLSPESVVRLFPLGIPQDLPSLIQRLRDPLTCTASRLGTLVRMIFAQE